MYLIIGCTASGKGKLAAELARRLGCPIISVDSMKVYRRMDIGTAKPPLALRQAIPHHMIDIVEPSESFSLGRYIELTDAIIEDWKKQAQGPIIAAGGTAMYLRGLLEGIFAGPAADPALRAELNQIAREKGTAALHRELQTVDPQAAERIHPNDQMRLVRALEVWRATGRPISASQTHFRSGNYRYPWRIIGVSRDKEDGNRRINARVKRMVEEGLFDEVKRLLDEPDGIGPQASQAVGYAEVIDYFNGRLSREEAIEKIKINSRRLAKHQRTWFRGFAGVNWFPVLPGDTAEKVADEVVRKMIDSPITPNSI